MSKYKTFLILFIIACVSIAVFLVFYFQSVLFIWPELTDKTIGDSPGFFTFFTPNIIIAGVIMLVANLAYRILGAVYITRITTLTDGEKVAWVLGFICFGFVTAIVFLLIANNRKFIQ